jgi:integrase
MPLSDTAIRNLKPLPGKTVKKSDGGGLQLWVHPGGGKTWAFAYRFDGKQRKLTLGPYPVIGLKDARERRDEAKRLLIDGKDPHREKQLNHLAAELHRANTFEVVAMELLEKKRAEEKAEATLSKTEWLINLALPAIGHLPVADISAPEVLTALRPIEQRKRYETARRLRAVIGEVFRYAIITGRAQGDPTVALKGALIAPKVKHRAAIIDPVKFGGLLRAIEGYDGMPEVRLALQLLALTFVRPGELRMARWHEFDFDRAIWSIPAERMKMRRTHRVPLAPQTVEKLEELRKCQWRRQNVPDGGVKVYQSG